MKVSSALAACAGLAMAGAAFGQFSGPYAPANWTFNANGGDGSVDTSGAPGLIALTGNNNGFGPIDTDYTILAAGGGTWSFSWAYQSPDSGTYDSAYYLLNGVPTFLADNGTQGNGIVSIPVALGDTIGFRVNSFDGGFGPGTLTIRDFSAPVPAPGTLALAALGGAVTFRRRRR
jgi:uncharacterized protein (TIGR03382 family)